ncbi:MAG: hypothetical protein HN423_01960 [Alphaproteobacteria bacterium]|nr:hypothetical protein [Alphaproteobacteria bacterium]
MANVPVGASAGATTFGGTTELAAEPVDGFAGTVAFETPDMVTFCTMFITCPYEWVFGFS